MDNYTTMTQMNNLRKAQLEKNKENWKLKSQDRLEKIVTTKMRTIMIGALAAIEKTFGDLWNDGVPVGEFEVQCHKEWIMLRQIILDLGNKQIRAVQKELQQYDIDWNKYVGVGQFTNDDEKQIPTDKWR